MQILKCSVASTVILYLGYAYMNSAFGQSAPTARLAQPACEIVVDDERRIFEIVARPGEWTMLDFPNDVREVIGDHGVFHLEWLDERVRIKPRELSTRGKRVNRSTSAKRTADGNVHIDATPVRASLRVRVAENADPTTVCPQYLVTYRDAAERALEQFNEAVEKRSEETRTYEQQKCQLQLDALKTQYEQDKREQETRIWQTATQKVRSGKQQEREKLLSDFAVAGLEEFSAKAIAVKAGTLDALPLKFARVGSLGVMQVKFGNHGQADRLLHEVRVLDTYGSEDHTMSLRFQLDGRTIPYARLEPGQHVIATITMENVHRLGNHFQLKVFEPESPDANANANDPETWLIGLDPPSENEGKLSVHVQGVYGAIWLADGIRETMQPKLDATSLKGLGVRLTYGLTKRLSFEAEVMGASSGEAEFKSFTWDEPGGMTRTADLYRSATLGRVQGGLMMRFGEEMFRPLVRLGLGLQGAGQSAEIVGADGVRMEGPEVPFEWSTLLLFGTGIDVQLGNHFAAGLGISVMSEGASPRSIEAGLHLAYGRSASR